MLREISVLLLCTAESCCLCISCYNVNKATLHNLKKKTWGKEAINLLLLKVWVIVLKWYMRTLLFSDYQRSALKFGGNWLLLSLVKMFNANISGNAETFGLSKATGYSAQNCFREQWCHLVTSLRSSRWSDCAVQQSDNSLEKWSGWLKHLKYSSRWTSFWISTTIIWIQPNQLFYYRVKTISISQQSTFHIYCCSAHFQGVAAGCEI